VLAWSGNWKLLAEVTDSQTTRVAVGVNDWDFTWRPNFQDAPSLSGYTTVRATSCRTASGASGALQLVRRRLVPGPGHRQRRLGDWWPDPKKFPYGLKPLIRGVNELGIGFGLWIEPEIINTNSDLYRAHPDWIIHFPTRKRTEMRNQHIFNLGRTVVQVDLPKVPDKLLRENNIVFIKWEMNHNVSEPGWPDAPGDARELWVRYVHGLYHAWGTLAQRHPQVLWQSCSDGGGRVDQGMLRMVDHF
jgi:alpha-galactosidase